MLLLVFIQPLELLFHLSDFVLEIEQNPVVDGLESSVERGQFVIVFNR